MDGVLRFIFAYFMSRYIANRAHERKSLSNSGRILATVVGLVVTWSSFCHFSALLTFFYVSNKATKYKRYLKRRLEEDFKEGGERNAIQVICNGIFPFLYSAFYIWDCGYGERPVDFTHNYKASKYTLAVLASLSCSCGDTLASEIGSVFPEARYNQTYHLVNMRKVPKGTNGGVSFIGTLASILGGLLVGISFYTTLKLILTLTEDSLIATGKYLMPPQWPIILIAAFSGFFGSLIDSILGELFQYTGYDLDKDCIVETPGRNVRYISGKHVLNNNQVNFLSGFFTAWFVPYLSWKLYKYF